MKKQDENIQSVMNTVQNGEAERGRSYSTGQRRKILAFLIDRSDRQMTAEEIVDGLKASGCAVGKATVYRYIEKLEGDGLVRRYFAEDGKSASFQYITSGDCMEHYHLKCSRCGKVIHLECGFMGELCAHIFDKHGFVVDSSRTVFYGLCGDCRALSGEGVQNG